MMEVPNLQITGVERVVPVGSQVTCYPPPLNSDVDYLVLADSRQKDELFGLGFELDGRQQFYEGMSEGGFLSYRNGEVNLIVTSDEKFFNKFLKATEEAKRLNLLHKEDRIKLFQRVLYDKDY